MLLVRRSFSSEIAEILSLHLIFIGEVRDRRRIDDFEGMKMNEFFGELGWDGGVV